jgi:magnesium transporter
VNETKMTAPLAVTGWLIVITVFHRIDAKIAELELLPTQPVPDEPVWIDLINPTPEEEKNLPQNLNIALPSRGEIWRNHALNRMYTRDGISYMTAAVFTCEENNPRTWPITFILTPDFLITIREADPAAFLKFQERLLLQPKKYKSSEDVLEALMEEIITGLALDNEALIQRLDALSDRVLKDETFEVKKQSASNVTRSVIRLIGHCDELNSKINESLHSLSRLLSYFRDTHAGNPTAQRDADVLLTYTRSLTEQAEFLSHKIDFQLEAALGMINAEQNLIAKTFTVVAVLLMPPTLISSIYGMNFEHMPELHSPIAYPIVLCVMLASALVPFLFLRRKGWL